MFVEKFAICFIKSTSNKLNFFKFVDELCIHMIDEP